MIELFSILNTLNIPLNNDTTKFIEKYVNDNGGIDRFAEEIQKEKIRKSSNFEIKESLSSSSTSFAAPRPAPPPPIKTNKNEIDKIKYSRNEERFAAAPPPVPPLPPPSLPSPSNLPTDSRNELLKSIESFNKPLKPVQNILNPVPINNYSIVDSLRDELIKMSKFLGNNILMMNYFYFEFIHLLFFKSRKRRRSGRK